MPSPTFTLVQTYAAGRLTVAHFDLYRLGSADELDEIGLSDAVSEGAVLIEWPERGAGRLPEDRLDIRFEIEGSGRRAELSGSGTWRGRIERTAPCGPSSTRRASQAPPAATCKATARPAGSSACATVSPPPS